MRPLAAMRTQRQHQNDGGNPAAMIQRSTMYLAIAAKSKKRSSTKKLEKMRTSTAKRVTPTHLPQQGYVASGCRRGKLTQAATG